MIFKTLKGHEVNIAVARYAIDWDPAREVSKPQGRVKAFLRSFWEHKLVLEEFKLPRSRMRLDLLNVTDLVAVEVSPSSTHTQFNPFMHGSLSGYRQTLKRDLEKERWCELNGLTLVTLIDEDIAALSVELFKERFGVDL